MKGKRGKAVIFRGLTSCFIVLMVLVGGIRTVAFSWEPKVNELLGIADIGVQRSQNEEDYIYPSDFKTADELVEAEIGLAARIQAEGSVLLKGNAAVGGTNVTMFGMRSHQMQYGGSMGGKVSDAQCVSLADALTENGFHVNPVMEEFYQEMSKNYIPGRAAGVAISDINNGTTVNEVPVNEYTDEQRQSYEKYKDTAIVVLGRDASEGADYYPGEEGISNHEEFSESATGNILGLSNDERNLISYVESQGFKKLIVLINSANTMELEELDADEKIDGILWIGNPGCYGTYGIAQILKGSAVPSGHLPDTYAVNTALSPSAVNFGAYVFENDKDIDTSTNDALRSRWYLSEPEGIYIGYKYYETRYYDSVLGQGNASEARSKEAVGSKPEWNYDDEVTYAFGYGIEGSSFEEEILDKNIDWSGETDSVVTVEVTNTGETAAKHVVQLYVSQPYTDYDKANGIEKAAVQLVGYGKTGEAKEKDYSQSILLEPGASENVTISFNTSDFRTYDKTYEHNGVKGAYIFETGEYVFATGNGAHDAVQAVLKYQRPEMMADTRPGGTVFTENLEENMVFTESGGVLIQNRLEDADLNTWDTGATLTYLTRSDWAGTFPKETTSLTATDEMIQRLKNAVYDSKEANASYEGDDSWEYEKEQGVVAAELIGLDYDDPLYEKLMSEVSLQDMVNHYTANEETLKSIGLPKVSGADSPLGLMGVLGKFTKGTIFEVDESDEYYGYETNVYESSVVVASTYSHLLASEEGRLIGNDSVWTLVTQWNGPGLNIHRSAYNARNYEYYSEDAVLTGSMGADLVKAAQSYGVQVTAKHFAFNDQETNREGIAVFLNEQGARENELRGFQITIEDGGLMGLMTAFNRIGVTHCGADQQLMNGILRGEWGYNGKVITDSVKSAQYFLPSECLMAGNDQMLGGGNSSQVWDYNAETFEKDPALQAALRESYHRQLYTAINSNRMNGITVESSVAKEYSFWQWGLTIAWGISIVLAALSVLLWRIYAVKKMKYNELEITADNRKRNSKMDIAVIVLMVISIVLFTLSYTTGYYTFGQMHSVNITVCLFIAIVTELLSIYGWRSNPCKELPYIFRTLTVALQCWGIGMILMDRVEAIGNCVVTDFDAGHGGEEAVYMSLVAILIILISVVLGIIKNFRGVTGIKVVEIEVD